jgi:hypothetical protein
MNIDAPPVMWLMLVVLGAMALGGMLAWATLQHRKRRQVLARRGLRPTDSPTMSPSTLERRKLEREAENERAVDDPTPVQPRDTRAFAVIAIAAIAAGVVALAGMFLSNSRYDGTGAGPISERPANPDANRR